MGGHIHMLSFIPITLGCLRCVMLAQNWCEIIVSRIKSLLCWERSMIVISYEHNHKEPLCEFQWSQQELCGFPRHLHVLRRKRTCHNQCIQHVPLISYLSLLITENFKIQRINRLTLDHCNKENHLCHWCWEAILVSLWHINKIIESFCHLICLLHLPSMLAKRMKIKPCPLWRTP